MRRGTGDGEDRSHERKNATGLIRQVEKRKDKDMVAGKEEAELHKRERREQTVGTRNGG